MQGNGYIYDIAFSYSNMQSGYIGLLASELRKSGLKVFSGKWEDSQIWDGVLSALYSPEYANRDKNFCRCVVVVFSKEYAQNYWENFKRECIHQTGQNGVCNIFAVLTDDTIPDEWPSGQVCIHSSDYSVEEIAILLNNKTLKEKWRKKEWNREKKATMITTLPDGSHEEVEILLAFKLNDTGLEYVVYTKNEVDENGNVTIYTSKVIRQSENQITLEKVSEEEWVRVRKVLRSLSSEDRKKLRINFTDSDGIDII